MTTILLACMMCVLQTTPSPHRVRLASLLPTIDITISETRLSTRYHRQTPPHQHHRPTQSQRHDWAIVLRWDIERTYRWWTTQWGRP